MHGKQILFFVAVLQTFIIITYVYLAHDSTQEFQAARLEYLSGRVNGSKWWITTDATSACSLPFGEDTPDNDTRIAVNLTVASWGELSRRYSELKMGHWMPPDCLPNISLAIIVPFRDRESHLKIFINNIIPLLQKQMSEFMIVVVEQMGDSMFNKAAVMNAAFVELSTMFPDLDCFVFHDVDLLPENLKNVYKCGDQPRHLGIAISKYGYVLKYDKLVGGALAFTKSQFKKINGYSNQFYGWGGEDDDMYYRMTAVGYTPARYDINISRYLMIDHGPDDFNPANPNAARLREKKDAHIYQQHGLNDVGYVVADIKDYSLLTWIGVRLKHERWVASCRHRRQGNPCKKPVPLTFMT